MAKKGKIKVDIDIESTAEEAANKQAEEILEDIENEANKNAEPIVEEENSAESIENQEDNSEGGILNKLKNKLKGEAKEEKPSELEQLKIEKAELNDKYVRLFAEFDNFRRRTAKEKLEVMKTAGRDIVTDLLQVLDDFDRASKAAEEAREKEQPVDLNGFELIHNKIKNTLANKGVKAIESTGELFNPDLHEAITEIPAPSEDLKGKIIDTIEKGYMMNDVIIRHPKVVVGK